MSETQNTRGRVCRCGRTFELRKDAADFLLCPVCRMQHRNNKTKKEETEMITAEDYDQIRYFWQEKRDFTRYYRWKDIEAEMRVKHPEFWQDYRALKKAESSFDYTVKNLGRVEEE